MASKQPLRCSHCKKLTVDEWVHQINKLANFMAKWENAIHPSGWREFFEDDLKKYQDIAHSPTCECEVSA